MWGFAAAITWGVGGGAALLAQHGGDYERADIERGAQLYDEFCSNCHGDEGDGVGNVNLKAGQFRHASTDQNFGRILTRGIPGTGMPPGDYGETDMLALIAYVRTHARLGDATLGARAGNLRGERRLQQLPPGGRERVASGAGSNVDRSAGGQSSRGKATAAAATGWPGTGRVGRRI